MVLWDHEFSKVVVRLHSKLMDRSNQNQNDNGGEKSRWQMILSLEKFKCQFSGINVQSTRLYIEQNVFFPIITVL